jgi:hypothetical protein
MAGAPVIWLTIIAEVDSYWLKIERERNGNKEIGIASFF